MQEIINNKELQRNLADKVHDMMLGKLRSIEGIDSVDWWPLAPGWWVLIIFTALLLIKLLVSYLKTRAYRLSWQYGIIQELEMMKATLSYATAAKVLNKLSEIIRRLAMHKYSRTECASLEGLDWLRWLKHNDNKKFDWENKGCLLIYSVYAPPGKEQISLKELKQLLDATKNWVI